MKLIDVNDFSVVKQCIYQGELYSVRDNGAVFRHDQINKRKRRIDNQWTFGEENINSPYLYITNTRIQLIVTTAFHGEAPKPHYVVDHIDNNCTNNRPENLRWLPRLDWALKDSYTKKRTEYVCGSVEDYLANPALLGDWNIDPNFEWMRKVTPEEAHNYKMRLVLSERNRDKPEIDYIT